MRLQGKTALITGGTLGIGRSIAETFLHEGARVVVTGRDGERGRAAATALGEGATFIQADMSSVDDVRGLAVAAIEALGQVDILVNNAASATFALTHETDEASFDAAMDTNVKGPFFLTAALAPGMAERGSGKIISISTMVASFGLPGMSAYGASKAAGELLTKTWAAEYGPRGVNVNAIAPGPILTEGTAAMGEGLNQLASQSPDGRPGRPEDIAAAALFLASDEARFVQGVTLAVDGGRTAV